MLNCRMERRPLVLTTNVAAVSAHSKQFAIAFAHDAALKDLT